MAESQLQEVGVDDAVYRFVDTVKQLPWVRIVALQGTAPTARIWTIISAPLSTQTSGARSTKRRS